MRFKWAAMILLVLAAFGLYFLINGRSDLRVSHEPVPGNGSQPDLDKGVTLADEKSTPVVVKTGVPETKVVGASDEEDPEIAVKRIMGLPQSERATAIGDKIRELLARNPVSVTRFAEAFSAHFPLAGNDRNRLLEFLAQVWADNDPVAAREWAAQLKGESRERAMWGVAMVLARTKPAEAAKMAAEMSPSGWRHTQVLERLVETWAHNNPEAAIQWAVRVPAADRNSVFTKLVSVLGPTNPDVAAQILALLPPSGEDRESVLGIVVSAWAKKDPDAALVWATKLAGNERGRVIEGVGRELARTDAAAAGRWAAQCEGDDRVSALSGVASVLMLNDPAGAAKMVSELLPASKGRCTIMDAVITTWAQKDPAAVCEWAQQWTGDDRDPILGSVAGALAQVDPVAAARMADELPAEGPERSRALAKIASSWAAKDPGKASEWVCQLPEKERGGVIVNVAEVWAKVDALAAGEWVSKLPSGAGRAEALKQVAFRWGWQDATAASEWARQLSESDRVMALSGAINALRQQNAPAAATLAVELPPGEEKKRTLGLIACDWAQRDLEATVAWATKLPQGDRGEALVGLAWMWAESDCSAAVNWIGQLQPGDDRIKACEGVAIGWASRDPAAAADWVSQLDEQNRGLAILRVANLWVRKDPGAASDWVRQLPQGGERTDAVNAVTDYWVTKDRAAVAGWAANLPEAERLVVLKKVNP
jgi:hypothetical protein